MVVQRLQRAWLTLVEKDLKFERKTIDLGNKPNSYLELYASIYPDPNAKAKVPIIVG